MGKYFPISTDSLDDLIELCENEGIEKEKLFELSTLLPILASWCICLDYQEEYNLIKDVVEKTFSKCTLQIWHPDESTDDFLYCQNASYESGATEAPFRLERSFEEMSRMLNRSFERSIKTEDISAFKRGFIFLPLIASRHFRTPPISLFWLEFLKIRTEDDNSKE